MKQDRTMVAGNWKMHKTYQEGRDLALAIVDRLQPSPTKVVLATPYIHLKYLSGIIKDITNLHLAAQNVHHEIQGAYTGEVSAPMLRSIGVEYVIVGHSERREYFYETDDLIYQKIKRVLENDMQPIYCCGERLEVRDAGEHIQLVSDQVRTALFDLEEEQIRRCVIAYEPVWAIGTGRVATPEQAQEMHRHIRNMLREQFGEEIAEQTTILYGGSVKPDNAAELFSQPDVDGGLVGGASLNAEDFIKIVTSI